ncbi:MAG TPA: LysR family transcriptional regulator [Pseudorhodoplanes sp.]|jgi:DNA-binding transcriptional LysR family regulator|nr:LysR family transcriptional regulator [Pseudorhodoplanes sp.]
MHGNDDWLTRSRLSPKQLALLVQLDEKRSVLHAAEAANLTQPAASKALGQLEEALGVPLFSRHARGVVPTPYGEILVRHARSVLAELKQTHDELEAARVGLSGEVRIGTAITSATTLVPEAVIALNRRSPRVRVGIELGFSEALVRRLLARRLDIVIARLHTPQTSSDVHFEAIAEDAHDIVVRSGHPLVEYEKPTLADTISFTWVLPPAGNVMRDRLNVEFLKAGLDLPGHVVETPSLPVIVSLLQSSDMIAPLATEVIRPYCESGALTTLPIPIDLRLGVSGIITLRGQRLAPAAQAMLEALRAAAGISARNG